MKYDEQLHEFKRRLKDPNSSFNKLSAPKTARTKLTRGDSHTWRRADHEALIHKRVLITELTMKNGRVVRKKI